MGIGTLILVGLIIGEVVSPIEKDRAFYKDHRAIKELINSDELIKHIRHISKRN